MYGSVSTPAVRTIHVTEKFANKVSAASTTKHRNVRWINEITELPQSRGKEDRDKTSEDCQAASRCHPS